VGLPATFHPKSSGASREDPLDRILAHLYAIEDAVAERTEPLPWGTAVFHDRVPWVREVNVVRVEATAPRIRAGELAFTAERRFPAAPAVEVLHEPIGAALAPAFAAAGWQVGRHLLMALEEPPPDAGAAVEEVAPDDVWALREEWMRSEPWGDDASVAAMLRWERWRADLTGARAFCAFAGGRPVSMCLLLATPHADEVERVYTTPSHRGRGVAYAVVGRALREAGDQLTFLFTDAHGAAQHLYARLGFKRAWVVYRFLRVTTGAHAGG
jgi:GNAT superfamily N-acetyltransferase